VIRGATAQGWCPSASNGRKTQPPKLDAESLAEPTSPANCPFSLLEVQHRPSSAVWDRKNQLA